MNSMNFLQHDLSSNLIYFISHQLLCTPVLWRVYIIIMLSSNFIVSLVVEVSALEFLIPGWVGGGLSLEVREGTALAKKVWQCKGLPSLAT